jgi:putative ABC transport system ATP-binding protein
MIKVQNLRKSYQNGKEIFEALKGINFEVEKGKSIAIVGKSGSGKSTLMHIMAGLDSASAGEVIYNDISLKDMNEKDLANFRNEKISFVFQQFFLQPNLTVLENTELPLKIAGISKQERIERARKALEEVGLSDKERNKATDLSGGQKQRVAIARSLVSEPDVIFADEPTGNLDTENGEKIIKLLFELNKKKNITLVIVTHDIDLANMCDQKVILKDGLIVAEEKPMSRNNTGESNIYEVKESEGA